MTIRRGRPLQLIILFSIFRRTSTTVFYPKPHYVPYIPPHTACVISSFGVAASSLSLISTLCGISLHSIFSYLLRVFPTSHFLTVDAMFLLLPHKFGSRRRWHYSNSINAPLYQSLPHHRRHFFQFVGVAVREFVKLG